MTSVALRGWGRRVLAAPVARFRTGGVGAVALAVRLTGAAVAAWEVALAVFPGSIPLLAPLTALLVVQLTPISLLVSGLDRVVSVVAGVLVAVAYSAVVPDLTWWSLGLAIASSILVGQALRLGANLIEVPISAMLVLGVGSYGAEAAAGQRVGETLVGAVVGVVSTLLLPPRIAADDAGVALRRLAERVADLLDGAGVDVAELAPGSAGTAQYARRAAAWLGEARMLVHDVPAAGSALLRAEEGRRLNLRALGSPDTGPGLRQGMEALEHSAVAVRSMFRSFVDAAGARAWTDEDLGPDIRAATSLVLHELGAGMRAFGRLVDAEALTTVRQSEREQLREALDGMLEAQARLIDLVLIDDPEFTELNVTLLATVRRLLTELDLDQRLRHLDRSRGPARRGPRRGVRRVSARRG